MNRTELDQLRDSLGRTSHALALGCVVMFTTTRRPGDAGKWALPPTPRAAIAYIDRSEPAIQVAERMVDLIVDAQTLAGYDIDRTVVHRRLTSAASKALATIEATQ